MNASVMEDKPTIYIKTLGGFSLRVGDKEITDNSNQSKKPWVPSGISGGIPKEIHQPR